MILYARAECVFFVYNHIMISVSGIISDILLSVKLTLSLSMILPASEGNLHAPN
jgi:hypothetical protein